ncbi:MAG: CDP-alcohol phosphatidyltransferase family protein [Anaerolineales bacterium]|nr:CDP-alcohol phosphatidyltransferase family protein [Anaerolineales bacterium]
MFDERMRLVKDTVFYPMAQPLQTIPPWLFSVMGLLAGAGAAIALWQRAYPLGFLLWFLNRVFDGLDGAVARSCNAQSDFGGYLDIIIDFIVYAAVPVGLALGRMETAVTYSLIFLLGTFYVNGASWMYLAAILEKRSQQHADRLTSVKMPAGLIGGTETIIFYTAFIFFPGVLAWLFCLMGLLVVVTILQRLLWAIRHLK